MYGKIYRFPTNLHVKIKKVTLYFWFGILRNKKRLKTPNGDSESVNRERTYDKIHKQGQKDKQRFTKHYA
jgi:hypothetical protein